jgi:hypothetical protein
VTVRVARTLPEVEALAEQWSQVAWDGEQAEHPYFVETIRQRSAEPLAIFVERAGRPVAAAAGRLERRRLESRIGYLRLGAPSVRMIQFVSGGLVAADPETTAALVGAVEAIRVSGEIDAVALPALPVTSPLYRAFAMLGGPLERQRFVPVWSRRLLHLPPTFDDFLASRSRKIRAGIRYDAKRLLEAHGAELRLEILGRPDDLEHAVGDMDRVAALTYQRALGAGFADTPERRALLSLSFEHGWARAYLLYRGDIPIAYWLCRIHGDTISLATTGYVPEYAPLRVGIYLLMRVIEDACTDPALAVLDFGPGRSSYKRHFSDDAYEEQNLTIFAPTPRARRINAQRTVVLGAAAGARRLLDSAQLTERLKTSWRRRLT